MPGIVEASAFREAEGSAQGHADKGQAEVQQERQSDSLSLALLVFVLARHRALLLSSLLHRAPRLL